MTSPVQNSGFNTISTGSGNDTVVILKAPGAAGLMGLHEVIINGKSQYMTEEELRKTKFDLGGGRDTLVVAHEVTVGITADGGDNSDVMVGGSGNDTFNGGQGADLLLGNDGHDTLVAGGDSKSDVLDGGGGLNVLFPDYGDVIRVGLNDVVVSPKTMDDLAKITRNL